MRGIRFMGALFRPSRRMRPARRLLLIFCLAILTPGLILGFFGGRALIQEGVLLEDQIQRRLDDAAGEAGRQLDSELREWQQAVDDIARSQTEDPARWPERVRRAIAAPGGGVILLGSRDRVHAVPRQQLLYRVSSPDGSQAASISSPSLAQAELLEVRQAQYDQAIALYRQLLTGAKPGDRAPILNGLARTLKKSGRTAEAARTYQVLKDEPSTRIGSLPSDLVAMYQLAGLSDGRTRIDHAIRVYEGLVNGRWQLEKASYLFYAGRAREWTQDAGETRRLAAEEADKLILTRAVEQFLQQPGSPSVDSSEPIAAFSSSEPFAAVVLGPQFIDHLLPAVEASGFRYSILGPQGHVLAGREWPSGRASSTHTIENASLPLRVRVWATDPAAMTAGFRRQRNLYAGAMVIVIALLAFGGYFTARTLKSELALAQMKSDFVSTVSHEFRSPLTGINQLAEMLRDGRVDDDPRRRHEYYEMIVSETRRLRRLVENVLDFSRMEDGRKQYRFERLEPAAWLREVTEDFRAHVVASGVAIESHIPPTLPDILADRETLTTAVNNLLDNAVKYSPTVKHVRVAAEADRQSLRISVRDQGVGISEEDRPRIFEKFFRGGGQLASQVKGVGLGLNLVQHIVRAHGGTIDFDSREGEGSTFTIRLNLGGSAPADAT